MNNNLSVFAEMPIRNVQYEAFEAVFSGALLAHINANKNKMITKLLADAKAASEFGDYTSRLPDISLATKFSNRSDYTIQKIPGSMSFSFDTSRYNLKVINEEKDMIETMLSPIGHRAYVKVISELLDSVENRNEAMVAMVDQYIENSSAEVERFEMIDKGVRYIDEKSSIWAQYEFSKSGLRFKFQTTLFLIGDRALTFHSWSLDSFDITEKEMMEVIQTLEF